VGNTRHTTAAHGRELYDFIRKHQLTRCLELGFEHGVGTIWLAGAVQSLGGGKVIAVDLKNKPPPNPRAADLVERAGLSSFVELYDDPISYTWHLKRNFSAYVQRPFDFVFIDGAHTWDTDGFAFFLVERILRPGGWILFDDLDWSYDTSRKLRHSEQVKSMSEEMRTTRQVRDIWELLVLQHPSFGNFSERGNWGWAQKLISDEPRHLEVHHDSKTLLGLIARKLMSVRLPVPSRRP
jgi:predicted O-methyltransferase YrrM